MARGTRPNTKANKVDETTEVAPTPEQTTEESTVTDTVEATPEATEATAAQTTTEAAADESKAELDLNEVLKPFVEAVDAALSEKDGATGDLAAAQVEAVKAKYQALDGLKAKNAAKKELQDRLRSAIAAQDVASAAAIMNLADNACVAGGSKPATEKAPADPAQAYRDRLVALTLAYSLVVNDVPEGVNAEEARAAAQEQSTALAEQADTLYTWTKSTDENKGDEPEASPLAKRAVRLALGRVSGGRSGGGTSTPHEGPRGNIARHIQLFFKDQPVGYKAKISEIANAKTEEYPDGSASPGAVNSRMKSKNPVPGVRAAEIDGKFAVEKVEDAVWDSNI